MAVDVDRLSSRLTNVADIWILFVEDEFGIGLLWRQLGVVAIAPIIIVLLSFGGQSFVSRFMPREENTWLQAISRRVKFTSNLLRSMKSVKLTGLVETSAKLLQAERIQELKLARSSRLLKVAQNVIGDLPEAKVCTTN
jgi:ATP-binding cassette subfamily C (CFTR/MRP) protein 1